MEVKLKRPTVMKRLVILLVSLLFIIPLIGCAKRVDYSVPLAKRNMHVYDSISEVMKSYMNPDGRKSKDGFCHLFEYPQNSVGADVILFRTLRGVDIYSAMEGDTSPQTLVHMCNGTVVEIFWWGDLHSIMAESYGEVVRNKHIFISNI